MKPDIVFFGENLPNRFHQLVPKDFPQADLLIVMGTSLVVHPFAGLIDKVGWGGGGRRGGGMIARSLDRESSAGVGVG